MNFSQKNGQTIIIVAAIMMSISLLIIIGAGTLVVTQEKKISVIIRSMESFNTAEAALEDGLLRIINPSLDYALLDPIVLNNTTATTAITQAGGTLTITATGNRSNQIRKLEAKLSPNTTGVSFNYGVLAGQGGFELQNTSSIVGNVYANGDITGAGGNVIQGDAWVAGGSGTVSGVYVKEDAHAHTISNISADGSAFGYAISGSTIGGNASANTITSSIIGGNAYYTTISGSTVGGTQNPGYPGSPDPSSEAMPIASSQIDAWKSEAAEGGTMGSYTLDGTNTASLGPIKVNGDLKINGSARLTITGIVWVTGNVELENTAVLQLHSSYGATSSALIVDNLITLKNSFRVCGSEGYNSGTGNCNASNQSYVLLLSTSGADPAIRLENSADVRGILYASNGVLEIQNSAVLKEATGYKIRMKNSAKIIYESGLINTSFSSGPSGGWDILSWKEI